MGTIKYSALRKKKGDDTSSKPVAPPVAAASANQQRTVGAKSTASNNNKSKKVSGEPQAKRQRVEALVTAVDTGKGKKKVTIVDEEDDEEIDGEEGDFVATTGKKKADREETEDDKPVNLDWSDSDDDYLGDEPAKESGDDLPFEEEDTEINPQAKKKKGGDGSNTKQQNEVPAATPKESMSQRRKKEEQLATMKAKKDGKDLVIKKGTVAAALGEPKKKRGEAAANKPQQPVALTPRQIINQVAFGKQASMAKGAKGPLPLEDSAAAKATASGNKLLNQVVKKLSTSVDTAASNKAKKSRKQQKDSGDWGEEEEVAQEADGSEFVKNYLTSRIEASAGTAGNPEVLMKEADDFFVEHSKAAKNRTKAAMKKLKEMHKANKAGGDKDGFRFVVPKNHKELIRIEAQAEGQSLVPGEDGSDVKLKSHFLGDGVDETDKKPGRKNKRKPYYFDDFYEFQKVKKWTDRAETFLQKTRFAKQAKHVRMQGQRNINKM